MFYKGLARCWQTIGDTNMISSDNFELFDPQKDKEAALPDSSGNYVIALRHLSQLPHNAQVSATPQLTVFHYKEKKYDVIYVGRSSKSLRTRDYRQHFSGSSGSSTLRKSIGCLLGFQLIPRDVNTPQNGKTKFNEKDENSLTVWMENNLLLFYYANEEYVSVEKELIKTYNPPLNLQGNFNKINSEFRKALSSLRTIPIIQDITPSNFTHCCPICGTFIQIPESLYKEKDLQCLSCGGIFRNPYYEQVKIEKQSRQWKYVFIAICILFIFNWMIGNNSNGYEYEYIGGKKELSQTRAIAGVRHYLRYKYLKDPDSYEGIEWGALGIYNKTNNTYFVLHKYRAKNSYGGYVIEENFFVLDKDGNVLKVVDDISEIVND